MTKTKDEKKPIAIVVIKARGTAVAALVHSSAR
jgi:hypothetical protein